MDNNYGDFARPEILSLVPENARRVLDMGCGGGAVGAALKQRHECEVWGIERDEEACVRARERLDKVLPFDLEIAAQRLGGLPDDAGTRADFDCIILADVLEHLREPEKVLAWARDLLTAEGTLIISLPNTRHWSVVGGLVEGNWTYEPAGLLDRSHLRFYTRREAEALFDRLGFAIEQEVGVRGEGYQEWDEAGRKGEVRGGRWQITGLSEEEAQDFYCYQWLFVLRAKPLPAYGLTSIVIPVLNGLGDTVKCLASLAKHTPEAHEIILVDNGSTDGTAAWAEGQGYRVIRNESNRGFPAACNQGIAAAQGDQVLLLNNDTLVTPGWLRRMIECLQSEETVGAVGPRTNMVSGAQRLAQYYGSTQELDGWAWGWSMKRWHEYLPAHRLVGFCLLLKRAALEAVGNFDEAFGLGNFEDDDLCRRLEAGGWKLLIANDSFVHHQGHATFQREGIDLGALLAENAAKLKAKWATG